MTSFSLKILSDSLCDVYIDGEFISKIEPNKMKRIPLEIGEYWVQIICCDNTSNKVEEIVNLQHDKVLKADFNNPQKSIRSDIISTELFRDYNGKVQGVASDSHEFVKATGDATSHSCNNQDETIIIKVKQNGRYRLLDLKQNIFISGWYEEFGYAENGYSTVKSKGKYGVLNSNGQETVPCIYEWMDDFITDGFVAIKEKGKYGIIDVSGNLIIPATYDHEIYFSEGLFSIEKDNKFGFLDSNGKIVLPFIYDFTNLFNKGFVTVSLDNRTQIIDRTGKVIFSNNEGYDDLDNTDTDGKTFIISRNKKQGVIDCHGNILIPCIYDDIDFSYNDDAPIYVCINGKYGFYSHDGVEIIPCIYDDAFHFNMDYKVSFVKYGGKYGLIDINGNTITSFIYDSCDGFVYFNDGLSIVEKNGKFGFINADGKEIIPCIYAEAEDFMNGYACVREGKTWNLINTAGEIIHTDIQKGSYAVYEGVLCLKKGNKFGVVDLDGNEIIPFIYDEMRIWQ